MAYQQISLSPTIDQTFSVDVEMGEEAASLDIRLHYNFQGNFWKMDIADSITKQEYLSNVPMLVGCYPAHNILRQFKHLGIGEAYIVKASDETDTDSPSGSDLGTEFYLVWGGSDG